MLIRSASRQFGATMFELIVAVSIVGILMAIGVPQLADWVRRNSVSSAAEVVQNGLRQAEGEAIRRNQRIEFLLTNGTPSQDAIRDLTAVASGANWASRAVDATFTPLTDVTLAYVNGFRMGDIATDVKLEGPANVIFNGTGRITDGAGAAITEYQVFRVSRKGADRAMCVFVTPGGSVRACDPAVASGKPMACLPLVSADKCPAP